MPGNAAAVNHRAPMLTLAEASEYVGVHPKTLRRRIADGHLRAYRMAGSRLIRVKADDLDALFRVVPSVVA